VTYSIVACDPDRRRWGVAVQSKFLAVGSLVSWAEPEVGAVATQAWANPRYGPNGLALLREGLRAAEVVERLVAGDEGRDERQLGVVDREGVGAAWTGAGCNDWAGHRLGAAQQAGGDRRGQQSASLLVVERDGGYNRLSDMVVDLRVDDHPRPIDELARLYRLHDRLFGRTPRDRWLPLEGQLGDEVRAMLAGLGHSTLDDWAGIANLEQRVDGDEAIDPIVLEALREAS